VMSPCFVPGTPGLDPNVFLTINPVFNNIVKSHGKRVSTLRREQILGRSYEMAVVALLLNVNGIYTGVFAGEDGLYFHFSRPMHVQVKLRGVSSNLTVGGTLLKSR